MEHKVKVGGRTAGAGTGGRGEPTGRCNQAAWQLGLQATGSTVTGGQAGGREREREQEEEQEQEQLQESQPNPTNSISPSTANLILATPTKSQVGRRQQEDNIDNRGMSAEAEVAKPTAVINRFLNCKQR